MNKSVLAVLFILLIFGFACKSSKPKPVNVDKLKSKLAKEWNDEVICLESPTGKYIACKDLPGFKGYQIVDAQTGEVLEGKRENKFDFQWTGDDELTIMKVPGIIQEGKDGSENNYVIRLKKDKK